MSQFKWNIIANFVGRGWAAAMALAFVPLYIRAMGIEAYGLVGLFTTMQAMFALLDAGLSTTLNREIARLSMHKDAARDMRDLVRTLEVLYWAMAAGIALVVLGLAPVIAHYWVKPESLSTDTVWQALILMGFTIALQFPFGLYTGGILGLQRQVLFNSITIGIATLRGLGSLLVLWYVSPTILAFFAWQICVSILQSAWSGVLLWHSLPRHTNPPRFHRHLLHKIWRFAAGIAGIGVLSLLLTQLDKLVLSKLLPLDEFGYYNLATVVASGLYVLISPIFTATFPRLSQLVSSGDEEGLKELYHRSCQLMSVAVLPVAIVVALFSREILWVWTRNDTVVQQVHLLVSLLIVGSALNGLVNVPYALQLAHGWTKLTLYQNSIAVTIVIPLLIAATQWYGAAGAASVWIMLNACYVVFSIPIMHRRLLPAEVRRWYIQDVGVPVAGGLIVAGVVRQWTPTDISLFGTIAWLLFVSGATLLTTLIVTPSTHKAIRQFVRATTRSILYAS